jgi:hypothetical protein
MPSDREGEAPAEPQPYDRSNWAARVVRALDRASPVVAFATWPECETLLPHWLACAELVERFGVDSEAAVGVLDRAGSYLRERAQYAAAEPHLRGCPEISVTTFRTA